MMVIAPGKTPRGPSDGVKWNFEAAVAD